jgi:hypothetical protein
MSDIKQQIENIVMGDIEEEKQVELILKLIEDNYIEKCSHRYIIRGYSSICSKCGEEK